MKEKEKKSNTISKKKNKKNTIPIVRDKSVEYFNSRAGKDVLPDPIVDPEEMIERPEDEESKLKYPPPKKNEVFRRKWGQFLASVINRENFHVGHLNSLEVLCDLYVDYEDLRKFIRINGRSYQAFGRHGKIWKFFPEVNQLNKVQASIKTYMLILGINLKRDESGESGGEKENWS